jgi:hypothetical protein
MLDFVKGFFCVYWDDYVVCTLLCLCAIYMIMCSLICICGTILVCLRWNQLHCGVWSFWYVIKIGLQEFYWEFLHLCSSRKLVCSFFVVHLPGKPLTLILMYFIHMYYLFYIIINLYCVLCLHGNKYCKILVFEAHMSNSRTLVYTGFHILN